MDLRQRLALLRQLQTQNGARPVAPSAAGASATGPTADAVQAGPAATGVLGLPEGVEEHATADGPVWWRERFHPASHVYGNQALAAYASVAPPLLALAAKDARLADVPPTALVLLDTETTGLSGGTGTVPFLIGTGLWQDGGLLIRQYFLPDYGHECAMLTHLAETIRSAGGLVSFNGKTFDQPLLATRFVLQRQRMPLTDAPHVDLLHPARRLWRRRLGDCSLTNLERHVLGQQRIDDVPGHLIPALYADYLHHRRPGPLSGVLQHNELDLLALAGLAVHLTAALEPARQSPLPPLDELSRAQWLEDLGRTDAALTAYETALSADLDGPARRDALWRLARLQRRLGDYTAAAATWTQLAAEGTSVAALVELAKHHEHRSGDLATALSLTEQALELAIGQRWFGNNRAEGRQHQTDVAALRHRQVRLQRKLAARAKAQ